MKTSQYNLISSLRALPRPVWVLFFGTFLNKFGAFVIPFLTIYLTGQGWSLARVGIAVGSYGVGSLMANIIGGYLADRIGRRRTIVLSMFSTAVAMMALSLARSFPGIVVLTALTGLTGELYRPAASAMVADLVPQELRVTAYSTYRMAFNAGWAFGPATAGFLAGHGYFWLFVGDAATSGLFGLVAFLALPHARRGDSKECEWGEALRAIGGNRTFHRVMLASFGIGVVFMQMFSTFGLQITELGFPARIYGLILSLNGALVVFCELPLTTVTRRFRPRSMMALGYTLGGIGFALMGLARSVPVLAGCMTIFTFGEMVAMPVSSAFIASLAPAHMRGRFMGVFGLVWAMAMVLGPSFGMRLLHLGQGILWIVCGALGLLAAAVIGTGGDAPVRPGLAENRFAGGAKDDSALNYEL